MGGKRWILWGPWGPFVGKTEGRPYLPIGSLVCGAPQRFQSVPERPGGVPGGVLERALGGGKGGKGGVLVAMCVNPETCSKRTTPKLLGAEDLLMAPNRATGKLKNGRGLAPPAQTLEYNCWTARRIPRPKILNLLVA